MNAAKALVAVIAWARAFSAWARANKTNATISAAVGLVLGLML